MRLDESNLSFVHVAKLLGRFSPGFDVRSLRVKVQLGCGVHYQHHDASVTWDQKLTEWRGITGYPA